MEIIWWVTNMTHGITDVTQTVGSETYHKSYVRDSESYHVYDPRHPTIGI